MQITRTYNLYIDQSELDYLIDALGDLGPYPKGSPQEAIHAHIHNRLISADQGED